MYTAENVTNDDIRGLITWLERASMDARFALMNPREASTATLRAEIMGARGICAGILNALAARSEGR